MGKKRQLGVALDDQLRSTLEALANKSDRSVADEIRSRIERTLKQDALPGLANASAARKRQRSIDEEILHRVSMTLLDEMLHDQQTRRLARELMSLARHVLHHTGHAWHAHPKAHEAFTEAVTTWLDDSTPAVAEGQWGQDDPKTLGRAIARMERRLTEEERRNPVEIWDRPFSDFPDVKKTLAEEVKKEEVNPQIRGRKGKKS
jgi:hypothetical protein